MDKHSLNFAKKVAHQTEALIAFVANLAIEQNEFDHFFHVLDEQHSLDIEKFKLQLGDELYGEYGAITSKEED